MTNFEKMWKEAVIAYSKVKSQNVCINWGKPQTHRTGVKIQNQEPLQYEVGVLILMLQYYAVLICCIQKYLIAEALNTRCSIR